MKHQESITTFHHFGRYKLIGPVNLPLILPTGEVSDRFSTWYFSFSGGQYVALVYGDPSNVEKPLVRIESICLWAHLFGSQYCDCVWQLEQAKLRIHREGVGLIIFALDQHGKGVGVENHFLVYAEGQMHGLEYVVDAYTELGFDVDYRKDYQDIADILAHFGMSSIRLLSNNPERIALLEQTGIIMERVPHEVPLSPHNETEMTTKKRKLGHLLLLKKEGQ